MVVIECILEYLMSEFMCYKNMCQSMEINNFYTIDCHHSVVCLGMRSRGVSPPLVVNQIGRVLRCGWAIKGLGFVIARKKVYKNSV